MQVDFVVDVGDSVVEVIPAVVEVEGISVLVVVVVSTY